MRARYSLAPNSGELQHQVLRISDRRQAELAALLNRIVLRAAEILGHNRLQQQCNDLYQTTGSVDADKLYIDLGKTVCALRLKYVWTMAYEPQNSGLWYGESDPAESERDIMRTIYDWFLKAREKLAKTHKSAGVEFRTEDNYLLMGGRCIRDPLPSAESDEGFRAWLEYGQQVLLETGLAQEIDNTPRSGQPQASGLLGQQFFQPWTAPSSFS